MDGRRRLHNFPTPHTDYITQYVDFRVPPEKVSELVAFDGSVLVDRTAGQIGARCDHEAYNTGKRRILTRR